MQHHDFAIYQNSSKVAFNPLFFEDQLPLDDAEVAFREISKCPHYSPTPLRSLVGAASRCGVARVSYKDESLRFGLQSFKALGGAYAVAVHLQGVLKAVLGRDVSISDIARGEHAKLTRETTVTCASDGNHGRSVAAGAKVFGCRCVIFLHEGVSKGRVTAVEQLGAQVVRTRGNYDDSVRLARSNATERGWTVISDTVEPEAAGDFSVPKLVMQGYRVLITEALQQCASSGWPTPTHVFVQGGVGGLAAAIVAHLYATVPTNIPRVVVVEPSRADCLFQSAIRGCPTPAQGDLNTIYAGLACGEVSRAAWPILAAGTDFFMTIPDQAAVDTMKLLAQGALATSAIVAGESAVAGLAGLLILNQKNAREVKKAVGISPDSHVLLIGTEGATDVAVYRNLVGGRLAEQALAGVK